MQNLRIKITRQIHISKSSKFEKVIKINKARKDSDITLFYFLIDIK